MTLELHFRGGLSMKHMEGRPVIYGSESPVGKNRRPYHSIWHSHAVPTQASVIPSPFITTTTQLALLPLWAGAGAKFLEGVRNKKHASS